MAYELLPDGGTEQKSRLRWLPRSQAQRRTWIRQSLLVAVALLLGRASIEHTIFPFALAYFVVLTELTGTKQNWPGFAVVVGAYLRGGLGASAVMLVGIILYRLLRKALFRKKEPDLHWMPFIAGLVDIGARLGAVGSVWTQYDVFLAVAEGALVVILSLIFIQGLPILIGKNTNRTLRNEQLVSITILMGSVITGLAGITIHGISVLQVAIDWIVLMMAAAGGVGVGTTAAIIVGVLSLMNHSESMANVAILGFSGLLGGILKEAKRGWMGFAFLASMTFLTIGTTAHWQNASTSIVAAIIATALFYITPLRLRQELATYVPGTVEHRQSEQERAHRIRAVLSERIGDISQVFEELAATFADTGDNQLTSAQQLLDHTVGSAAQSVCGACPRRSKCWDKEGYATYQSIVHTVAKLEATTTANVQPTRDLKDRCIRIDSMMGVLKHNLDITDRDAKWIQKMREQRVLVSAQLSGVAGVVRDVVQQIEKGNESSIAGEEQILTALEQLGLYVDHVHIVSLDPGKVEIEVSQPSKGAYENSVRMIAPLLSGVLGENISVAEVIGESEGPCTGVFTSARRFDVVTAVATAARDGKTVSGDSFTSLDLGNGRYALAVSDGMGNGERARRESKAALELLKKLMKAGFDEQLAIKTVNSTLLLRSQEEMFTTLDMALIDLYSAKAEFLKVSSAPSFIKRGDKIRAITGDNVPIGILQDIEVQSIDEQLRDGDLLIVVSDGIYDAPGRVYDKEDWLKRQIEQLTTNVPQEIADTLVEAAARINHGQIRDDMTVVVAKISAHQPEWASIKVPGIVGIRERKRRGA